MASFGIPVRATREGAQSSVSVETPLDDFGLRGLVLRSSDRQAPNIADTDTGWPEGLAWTVQDRLRSQGAKKGRVLAVWDGDTIVAVCSWHLHETGPPVIFDLGSSTGVDRAVAQAAEAVLLLCLREIASRLGRDTESLRWTDRPLERMSDRETTRTTKGSVRERAKALGFEPLRPRPKWLKGRWVTERRF